MKTFGPGDRGRQLRDYCTRNAWRRKCSRDGATVVETAIILLVFLTLVLGMLDLGIAVFRAEVLAHAAREGTRKAIVHGSLATDEWGPATVSQTADSGGHPIVSVIRPFLIGMDLSEVTVTADWPDGNIGLEAPVRVTLTAPYQPMMTFIFGNPTYTLRGTSTMRIVH